MFNKTIYQQTFGTPMGSPFSPVIADTTLQDLEDHALNMLGFHVPFYHRYSLSSKSVVGLIYKKIY